MATGLGIRIDVERDEIRPYLRLLANKMGSLERPLSLIGSGLVTSTKKRFEYAHGPVHYLGRSGAVSGAGAAWPPLAPSTIAKRRKGPRPGRADKALMDSRVTMGSIHHNEDRMSLAIGTNHEINTGCSPAIHQFGGKAGRGRQVAIPARPFLGFDDGDVDMARDVISNYLGLEHGL